jgi:Ca2+-binding RTX toxin-like protein
MKHFVRISAVTALLALVAAVGGVASAAPDRRFTADFRDSSGNVIIPCVLTGATNDLTVRFTKVHKQGPPIRGASLGVDSTFTDIAVGSPTASQGTWSSSASGNTVSIDGRQLKQAGSWVQAPITNTTSTVGVFTWAASVRGPGRPQASIMGTHPTVHVVEDFADCPPGTTPVPPPDGEDGGTTQQSGAGTPCVSPTITGGVGDSLVIGTPGNDVILDLLGNNHIEGRGGNDVICTGPGNDVVLSLNGSDVLFDQGGNNLLRSGGGNDKITAGDGNDRIASGAGADHVVAGDGKNNVRLGKGRDKAFAGAGNDTIKGARGKDTIRAGDGKNRLGGGKGNDKLVGGKKRDVLNGSAGRRDVCRGKGGKNIFRGCEVARGRGA